MKKQILEIIFDRFEDWSKQFGFACNKGCAVCCTIDVSITAPEGELLLDYIVGQHGVQWLSEKLDTKPLHQPLSQTTNEYAQACLEGRESEAVDNRLGGVCPLLEENICSVYPARPFSCRCFASTVCCRHGGSALLPSEYLSAATAVSQIIEHLGQLSLWGTMIDVVTLQAAAADHISHIGQFEQNLAAARGNCLTAKPLPGFLIEDGVADKVHGLVEEIFASEIAGKTIEDILNNR